MNRDLFIAEYEKQLAIEYGTNVQWRRSASSTPTRQ
jgi:hypothetical protein